MAGNVDLRRAAINRLIPMTILKRAYVGGVRALTYPAQWTGLLTAVEARSDRRWAHWLRTLAAIHSIDEMVRLDVPWWTYDAIGEVERFLRSRPRAQVFEYGSGASTVWLAKRTGAVISVEHDPDWFQVVQKQTTGCSNVDLILAEPGQAGEGKTFLSFKAGYHGLSFEAYVRTVERWPGPYDLIVIDGRARVDCLCVARRHLAQDGLIVFDNSGRRHYRAALAECGGSVRHMRGLVPSLPYPDQTSLITFPAPSA